MEGVVEELPEVAMEVSVEELPAVAEEVVVAEPSVASLPSLPRPGLSVLPVAG
jgi:hypothetical protein